MGHELIQPPPLRQGDRVAVLSPSWAAPGPHPEVHEQAMARVRDLLGLEPVEYPTTRRDSTPQERAADITAALRDDSIRAVLATIGGEDQITVLRHLDPALPREQPKAFVGYSDNTNLLNWLWFHGLAAVHGGSTQVHLGRGPAVDAEHLESLRAALFGGDVVLTAPLRSRDTGLPWTDPRSLTEQAPSLPAEPWTWSGPARTVTGPTWGGNLEVLTWTLAAGRYVLPNEAYAGCVLLLETSEERPPPGEVYRMMRNLGERGVLEVVPAVLWGRPPAGDLDVHPGEGETRALRAANREAVLRAVGEYHPDMVVVLDVDFGHTMPQWVLPYGGSVTVDAVAHELTAHFGSSAGSSGHPPQPPARGRVDPTAGPGAFRPGRPPGPSA
ncbi:MAG TPA: S66 peptidase family protein [Dermatophilaceae bacterium]|nr:S66 peptidase family protein [Dermatophilaceae bacterium]